MTTTPTETTAALDDLLNDLMQPPRIPRATYRLQFNADFTFADAQALVDYLDALGISHIYTSPLFKPRTGSTHGYDIVDYNEFNPVLGSEAASAADAFNALSAALRERDMGLILDIVPNHMGVNTENAWWMDVLKHGPASEYAHYFDIDWQPRNRALDNKVLLPILGDHFGRILEAGELQVVYWHGDFYVHYYEHQLPLSPDSYGLILRMVRRYLLEHNQHEPWVEMSLSSVIHSLDYMPHFARLDDESLTVRRREQTIVRWRLLELFDKSAAFRDAQAAAIAELNGHPDDPSSYDPLDDILQAQPYRLSYWRVATDEINYRRFFDINDMAAVRIEAPDVFADTHRLALRLIAEGRVNGLRVDHPDGLWNPEGYFWELQEAYLSACIAHELGAEAARLAPVRDRLHTLRQTQPERAEWPLYVLVEKILSSTEPLPYDWAVHGTTGYDFMYAVNNLFVDMQHEDSINTLYTDFIATPLAFAELIDYTKKQVMSQSLTSEIESRAAELDRLVERHRRYQGFTRNSIAYGLSEIIAALPIYRTYISGPTNVDERDQTYIEAAVEVAKTRNPMTPNSVFDFLRDVLLFRNWQDFDEDTRADLREFVMKFQQITGPVMAKSVEDTAFYIYNRMTSLNEVGGHPERFGASVQDFHEHNQHKAFPYAMLSTSTHDTKRSEDVRMRISVLSEVPDQWALMLTQWATINEALKTIVNGQPAPTANDEYLLYQTLIGSYPSVALDETEMQTYIERIEAYMLKAINEAKQNSNWVNPNEAYAQAVRDFVRSVLTNPAFRDAFEPFQRWVAYFGRFNSLSQTLLKLTARGIPDIYQGNELWDFSMVDPDNRRPVDFVRRHAILTDIQQNERGSRQDFASALLVDAENGAIKLYTTYRTLSYRRQHEALFREGDYIPLAVHGERSEHVCAFIRQYTWVDEGAAPEAAQTQAALIMVPRLPVGLVDAESKPPLGPDVWRDTRVLLPDSLPDKLRNIFTHETPQVKAHDAARVLYVGDVLTLYPLALLTAQ
jgi:(1->4)-alpha-D-glucan 1-alpha-D-glucosylmutase